MLEYAFLVDNQVSYPYELIDKYRLYHSENLGDVGVFIFNYDLDGELEKAKVDFDITFAGKHKFNLKYYIDGHSQNASMYTNSIMMLSSQIEDKYFSFLMEKVWPVAIPLLEKEYEKGNLQLPVFFFFGESMSYNTHRIERYEIDFLALMQYAFGDFDYFKKWKNYTFYKEDIFLVKYGDYEKPVQVNVTNCFDNLISVRNIKGLEAAIPNVSNWIWADSTSRTRVIGFNYSSIDCNSDIVKLLTKKDFWTKFILPQFFDSDVYEKFNTPISDKTFLVSKFVKELLEVERKELYSLEENITIGREQIELDINSITLRKLKLVKQEAEALAKKKAMTSETKLKTSLANQMVTLMAHPYVEDIEIGEKFVIKTTPIKIDGVVPVGGYYITLTMGRTPSIRVVNYENPREGFDHPHISNGNPCWGNYTDILVHIANTDLISTMEIMFRFLESWNPADSWGKNLIWWDAKHAFGTLKDMNLMDTVERKWEGYYQDAFGEHMDTTCGRCGEYEEDCCCYCPKCDEHIDNCGCRRCAYCLQLWEDDYHDCRCDRCHHCEELDEDCECSWCNYCGENEDVGNCTCDHCPTCGENDTSGDCECDRCTECRNILEDCECERCVVCSDLVGNCDCEENPIINVREGQIQMETV